MTFAHNNTGIYRQRGFWLRCFLGRACFGMAILSVIAAVTWARVEPAGPLHLWSLRGFYMSGTGKPIENAEITLQRDGAVLERTVTDDSGRFAFAHVRGRYTLHIDKSSNHSQLSREVLVGLETATLLRKNTLYIVAGPGACTDDCSSIYTSKYEFEQALRRNAQHHR
jgi:Carboxypeptidase regulatory-like domain